MIDSHMTGYRDKQGGIVAECSWFIENGQDKDFDGGSWRTGHTEVATVTMMKIISVSVSFA